MNMENKALSFQESLLRYMQQAEDIRNSLPPDQKYPDYYYQDETGDMALSLRRKCIAEYDLNLSDIDNIKLYQLILTVLDGEENPGIVTQFAELQQRG